MIGEKRGQSLSISTLVIIVLALVVLIFLIYGFSVGWSNLFDNITNLGGGNSNVQAIVQACSVACSTQDRFGYTETMREVNLGDGTEFMATCDDLEDGNVAPKCVLDETTLDEITTEGACKGSVEPSEGTCKLGEINLAAVSETDCTGSVAWVPRYDAIITDSDRCNAF